MRASTKGWIGLGIGVLTWEFLSPRDQLLSHGFDVFLEKHPVITWAATIITVAHLLNITDRPGLRILDPWNAVGTIRDR